MKTSDNWKKRIEKRYQDHFKDYDAYAIHLRNMFYYAREHYNERIEYYIRRIAANGDITEKEVMKAINGGTLDSYNMNLEEFTKWAQMGDNASPEILKMLDDASSLVHISHFQAMTNEMNFIVAKLWEEAGKDMLDFTAQKYADNFYHTAKDLQDLGGKYKRVTGLSKRNIKDILSKPWAPDGKDFLGRIWDNRAKLAAKLQFELVNVVSGMYGEESAAENIAKLAKVKGAEGFNVSLGNAKRLVHSELHHALDTGQVAAFKEQGVPKYQFLATLDNKTTPFCQAHDHKVYKISEYQEGVTAPPHGPWCRSTIIPRYDDDELDNGERAARDPKTGKSVLVSAKLSYPEWYEEYVENTND